MTVNLPEDLADRQIHKWSTIDVKHWLNSFGMEKYASDFESHNVDGKKLCTITEAELESVYCVTKVAHRKKIRRRLAYLQAKEGIKSKETNRLNKNSLHETSSTNENIINNDFSLYVHGIHYEYKKSCTFCQKKVNIAVFYCRSCNDFLCVDCDQKLHGHIKRSHHKRTRLSKRDANQNGQMIIHFFRFLQCRDLLRKKVRESYGRYYDPMTKRHYYRNFQTNDIQWFKPLCLGLEELKPFLNPETAAIKLQGIFRRSLARVQIVQLIHEQYHKIYHLSSGRYCYYYNGISIQSINSNLTHTVKSKLITKHVKWKKPQNLRHHQDIPLLFTKHLAILRIQLFSRSVVTKRRMKTLIRSTFQRFIDPITGDYFYRNECNGVILNKKPLLLKKEPWNPDDIREWEVEKVILYFRRLGFRKFGYIDGVKKYSIDGPMLLAFHHSDFRQLGVSKSIHIKKIMIDLGKKSEAYMDSITHTNDTLIRRARFRRHHDMINAAELLQRMFRKRSAMNVANRLRRAMELQKQKNQRAERRVKGVCWWPELCKDLEHDLTVKQFGRRAQFQNIIGL